MTNFTEFETFGQEYHGDEIAVVGMALRVPGANTVEAFWELLQSGLTLSNPSMKSLYEHPV